MDHDGNVALSRGTPGEVETRRKQTQICGSRLIRMRHLRLALLTVLYVALQSQAKILRNNALMTKMITHFQQDNNLSNEAQKKSSHPTNKHREEYERTEQRQEREPIQNENDNQYRKPDKILNLMQDVLCRNFPTIPCSIIMQDDFLNRLIQRSIQQIVTKKMNIQKTTPKPANAPALLPIINSEDLSNFLEVSHTGFFGEKIDDAQKRKKKKKIGTDQKVKNQWSHEKPSKKKFKGRDNRKWGTELYSGRNKMRKFYPHKIKYKDKNPPSDFRDRSEEKVSMSVEMPDVQNVQPTANNDQMTYKVDPAGSPVWRIDYMKHGVPSFNSFGFEDESLRTKLYKPNPSNVASINGQEHSRKEVLHPDVYIKKNFVRKNNIVMNSDVME